MNQQKMYCPNPQCPFREENGFASEFGLGTFNCSDCGSELQSWEPAFETSDGPQSPLVEISSFNGPEEAHHAQQLLMGSDIPAMVHDDGVVGVAPHLSLLVGGVKLMVPEQYAKQAQEILNNILPPEAEFTPTADEALPAELRRGEDEEGDDSLNEESPEQEDDFLRSVRYALVLLLLFLLMKYWLL